MSQKFKILSGFIKDMSSETPDIKSYSIILHAHRVTSY